MELQSRARRPLTAARWGGATKLAGVLLLVASLGTVLVAGPLPTAQALVPGGIARTDYTFSAPPSRGFYNLDAHFTVLEDEGESDYFWAQQFSFGGGEVGYMGLQSNGLIDGQRVGKTAIFSVFSAVSAPGESCEAFANEGTGYSCRIEYEWIVGREYRLRVHEICCAESPAQDERWGAWIMDMVTGEETLIGSITVPGRWGWLESSATAFTEYFGDVFDCSSLPNAKVRLGALQADTGRHAADDPSSTTYGPCAEVARASCPDACYHEVGLAPGAGRGGPLVLMGIDAEEGGPGEHGPVDNYTQVVDDILAQARGGTGILVVGAGKYPDDDSTSFWEAVLKPTGETFEFVNGAAIEHVNLENYRMIAVASTAASIDSDASGLTDAESSLLAGRRRDIARFVNQGGGLLGLTQTGVGEPYTYLADLGAFSFDTDLSYDEIAPSPEGVDIGVSDEFDVCCWHDDFAAWPNFLNVLALNAEDAGHEDHAAALGGVSVVVPTRGRYRVEVRSFIPGDHVRSGGLECDSPSGNRLKMVFNGDDRSFASDAGRYKTQQRIVVVPNASRDEDGFVIGSYEGATGLTRLYAGDALEDGVIGAGDNDGRLLDCHLLHAAKRLCVRCSEHLTHDVQRFPVGGPPDAVILNLSGKARNPLRSRACAINYDLRMTIVDHTDDVPDSYSMRITHDGFPAYEVYVNDELVYSYEPGGSSPYKLWQLKSLCPPQDVEESRSGDL